MKFIKPNVTHIDFVNDPAYGPYRFSFFREYGDQDWPKTLDSISLYSRKALNEFYKLVDEGKTSITYINKERPYTNFIHIKHNDNRKVIICVAGGGYQNVCIGHESLAIGLYLYSKGYDPIILTYGVKELAVNGGPTKDLADVVKYLVAHQKKLKIDMNGYAVMGSSAGGFLVSQYVTNNHGYLKLGAPKPLVVSLQYPVISSMDENIKLSKQTRHFALGDNPSVKLQKEYSSELHIDKTCPPCFIVSASEDTGIDDSHRKLFMDALKKKNIEFTLYEPKGTKGHGWGIGDKTPFEGWVDKFIKFLEVHR